MKKDFYRNKVVVITGATGGVGRVTAKAFAAHGAKIALLARDWDQLSATKKEVQQAGGKALPLVCDVADAEQVEAAAEQVESLLGPIDVWVNNAMNSVFSPIINIRPAEFKRVTEVTYLGQVYGTLAALKRMQPRNKGSIVFVGSALAYRGIPLQSAYCAAKHAIDGFYDSLRSELIHDRSAIKTCMVHLPAMNTTQFGWVLSRLPNKPRPMGKVYQPEVAAKAILFAASVNRRSIWVGYPTFKAIIGSMVAAGLADRILAWEGYGGQQTNEPDDPHRANNLWKPVPGDQGAYGVFGDIAVNRSLTLWASINRGVLAAAAGAVALALLIGFITSGRRK